MTTPLGDPKLEQPTRSRFVLALWLCGLMAVLYLDRICMSQALDPIQKELKLSNTELSYVLMAFTLAYGLFEIPTGRWGDRFGSRKVLVRIVVWWSLFTAFTGVCTGFYMMVCVRFLFGAGEAGAFPNAFRVIARWFPLRERGRVQGVMLASAQFGAVVAPLGAAALIEALGWRWTFAIFGAVGVVWAVGFWMWFRDDPTKHPAVNAAEVALIQDGLAPPESDNEPVPWRAGVTNTGILELCAIVICAAFYTYFVYSWFPKYLISARGVDNITSSVLAAVVLSGSAFGILLGGWLSDRVTKHSADPVSTRRKLCVSCYAISAVSLLVGIQLDNLVLLTLLYGLSFFAMHITVPNWWSVAVPQCGTHVGTFTGLMNGAGVVGALLSQWFVGVWTDLMSSVGFTGRDQWDTIFNVYVAALVCAGTFWWLYQYKSLK